jgi:DNA polymerase
MQNISLIGEAPGENEVKNGVPFCGQAGKNLSELINISGISREDFCITNGFCFRTFKSGLRGNINRTPTSTELKAGAYLLEMELQIIKPKMIILLGLSALKAFKHIKDTSLKNGLKNLERGHIASVYSDLLHDEIVLAHTFHPSPLVYNQKAKRESLQDFFKNLGNAI